MSNLKNNWINGDIYSAAEINRVANAVNTISYNVKTYGAVGDGVTNDAPAIQSAIDAAQVGGWNGGGTVYFPPGRYLLGSTLLVKEAFVQIAGASAGGSRLIISSASSTFPAITFTGYKNGVAANPADNSTWPWNFSVRDIWIEKTVPVANSTPAISLYCIQKVLFYNVNIRGFGTGIYCTASYNVMAYQVVIQSNSAATTSPLYGWRFNSDYPCFSSYLSHCFVSFGLEDVTTVTTYGFYHAGAHPSDWFLDHCEADVCTVGFYWSGGTATTWHDVLDIHFVGCIADQCQIGFDIVNNLSPGTTGGMVDIDSCYWANRYTTVVPTPNSVGVRITNCSGVSVRGFMAISGNDGDPTNYQNNYGIWVAGGSKDISISGLNLKGNAVQGIFINNSSFVTCFGNTIFQTMSIGGNGIWIVNSTKLSIAGNTIRCLAGLSTPMANGIKVDATSTGIALTGNVIDTTTVTTPLSIDAGGSTTNSNNIGF